MSENILKIKPGLPYPLVKLATALGYGRLADAFVHAANVCARDGDPHTYFSSLLSTTGIRYTVPTRNAHMIPARGPLVIVANHPYGVAESMIAGHIVSKLRSDFKIAANPDAAALPGIAPFIFPIEPYRKNGSHTRTLGQAKTLFQAKRYVENGGCLIIFPAGKIAKPVSLGRPVTDAEWRHFAAYTLQKIDAPVNVLPMYFEGHNSWLYETLHAVGITGPTRVVMQAYETLRLARRPVPVHLSNAVSSHHLPLHYPREALTAHLRKRTFALAPHTDKQTARPGWAAALRIGG